MTDFNVFVRDVVNDSSLRSDFQKDPVGTARNRGITIDPDTQDVLRQMRDDLANSPPSTRSNISQSEVDRQLGTVDPNCGWIKSKCTCKFKIF